MTSKLPGWSFILVGLAVIGFSKLIEAKTASTPDPANLVVFFWIGIGFVVFGAYREFVPRMRKSPRHVPERVGPPPHRTEPQNDHRHPAGHHMHGQSPHTTHQHTQPTQHPSHPYQPATKPCPRCHGTAPNQNRFCIRCGYMFY